MDISNFQHLFQKVILNHLRLVQALWHHDEDALCRLALWTQKSYQVLDTLLPI